MSFKKCKNMKCQRILPDGYKHKFCENCRNEHVKQIKDAGKAIAGVAVVVGGTILTLLTKGKFDNKE